MGEVSTAIRQGDTTVSIDQHPYDVWWIQEPGDDDEVEQKVFTPKTVTQLILRPVSYGSPLSFYGKNKETCLEHLDGWLNRRCTHAH